MPTKIKINEKYITNTIKIHKQLNIQNKTSYPDLVASYDTRVWKQCEPKI